MRKTLQTALSIESWDEQPTREHGDGRKFTRAQVRLGGPTGDQADGPADQSGARASATYDALLAYAADGTSTYVTMMEVTAVLDGRAGSFVLTGSGTFDGTTADGRFTVVPGSGTGELAGISGSATSRSTHDDYPAMPLRLEYDLP